MTDNTGSAPSLLIDTSRLPSIKDIKKDRNISNRKKNNNNNRGKKGVGKRSNVVQDKKRKDALKIQRNVVNLIQTENDKELMKKRVERFGNSLVSSVPVAGLDDDAKKAARAERFGIMDDDAKKAARAQRFGIITDADRMKARAERFGMK